MLYVMLTFTNPPRNIFGVFSYKGHSYHIVYGQVTSKDATDTYSSKDFSLRRE